MANMTVKKNPLEQGIMANMTVKKTQTTHQNKLVIMSVNKEVRTWKWNIYRNIYRVLTDDNELAPGPYSQVLTFVFISLTFSILRFIL
jgi:hypothetical protein